MIGVRMKSAPLLLILLAYAIAWAALFLPSQSSSSLFEECQALRDFKKGIFEDPLYTLSDWNQNDEDPCSWNGVLCSGARDHVLTLNLANSSLKGFVASEIGSLRFLQKLILSNNLLLGSIPKEIGMLANLIELDLSSNQLTGPIPSEIGGLVSISKINFHSNGLTGKLPPELGNLLNLVELRVDRNKLEGPIPGTITRHISNKLHKQDTGFCRLKNLQIGDFSYNFFVGKIPPCMGNSSRYNFHENCFTNKNMKMQRTPKTCGVTGVLTHGGSQLKNQKPQRSQRYRILEIVTGVVLIIFLASVAFTIIKWCTPKSPVLISWKKISSKSKNLPVDSEMLKHVLRFSRHELEVACEDFSNIIGSSSYSVVYKGIMEGGPEIAVISLCVSMDQWTNHLEFYFQTEISNLARLVHENTAKLLGYCTESDPFTKMLVFEYASNGTLCEHLHYSEGCQLSWSKRMKISIGIARGLRYMHNEVQPPFSLSELHSSAVYLTEDFTPNLVDFESWKAVLSKAENSRYIGNRGFVPFQNLIERTQVGVQGNTFAFGALLLEIISGRRPFCKDQGCLVDWAIQYLENPDMMCKLVDPELKYFNKDDLRVICSVVSLSVQNEPIKRPSMQILTAMLENGIDTSSTTTLKESPLAWAELALLT